MSLTEEEICQLDAKIQAWVEAKAFRLPDATIEAVAGRFQVESAQLHRYCLERLGMDFRTWRTALRIEDAKEQLLSHPQEAVSTIGRRVGFNDRSNFTRQFHLHTGHSPAEWRALFG